MPKRPRQHQLEEISILEFRRLLPPAWVFREKSKDYGIDAEVEIFDERNNATGLIFYVQLKATDKTSQRGKVSVRSDHLSYLSVLDVPTIFARYYSADNEVRWKWIFDLGDTVFSNKRTATLHFSTSDIWQNQTPSLIIRTLQNLRLLTNPNPAAHFALRSTVTKNETIGDFQAGVIVSAFVENLPFVVDFSLSTPNTLVFDLNFDKGYVSLSFDRIVSLTFEIDGLPLESICDAIIYGFMAALHRYGFERQAVLTARHCLSKRRTTHSRYFGSIAAQLLADNAEEAVEIAILNGVHLQQDQDYGFFLNHLLASGRDPYTTGPSVVRFFTAALGALQGPDHDPLDSQRRSAILYSLGNFLSKTNSHERTIRLYNQARKLNPEYITRNYFLVELAGCLFLCKRYSCATAAYQMAIKVEPSASSLLGLADSLLFGRKFSACKEILAKIDVNSFPDIEAEVFLKTWIVEQLSTWNVDLIPPLLHMHEKWIGLADESVERGAAAESLVADLILSLYRDGSTNSWVRSIWSASAVGDIRLITAVIFCAHSRCGFSAYEQFRSQIGRSGIPDSLLAGIDRIASDLYRARGRHSYLANSIIRSLREYNFDIVLSQEPNRRGGRGGLAKKSDG